MVNKEIISVAEQGLGLNKKLKNVGLSEVFDKKKIEAAEAYIENTRDVFLEATLEDMLEIQKIFNKLSAESIRAEVQKMQELAFSIKSRAATAGFPLASAVARSLFEFCEKNVEGLNEEKYGIAKLHIKALDDIISENFDTKDSDKEKKLLDGLSKLTSKF